MPRLLAVSTTTCASLQEYTIQRQVFVRTELYLKKIVLLTQECCGSEMFTSDHPSSIPDPGFNNKKFNNSNFFSKIMSPGLQQYGLGSGNRTGDPGSRKNLCLIQVSKRHRTPELETQHCKTHTECTAYYQYCS
jgi:hypothetical protein